MPLPIYATQADVPAADATDFVEYKGKWHQKDWVAAKTEEERVKTLNAGLINEKATAEQLAATEKTRADNLEVAARANITQDALAEHVEKVVGPIKTENATLKAKLDRTELEKLARSTKDTGLWGERLDDPDNMDVVLRNVALVNGAPVVMTTDASGKQVATATPFADHLKSFLPTKPWLYKHPGGSGGDAQHNDGEPAKPDTAIDAAKRFQAQRDAARNPLAPPKAAA